MLRKLPFSWLPAPSLCVVEDLLIFRHMDGVPSYRETHAYQGQFTETTGLMQKDHDFVGGHLVFIKS